MVGGKGQEFPFCLRWKMAIGRNYTIEKFYSIVSFLLSECVSRLASRVRPANSDYNSRLHPPPTGHYVRKAV